MSHWKACISTIDTTLLDVSYSRVVFSDPSMGKGYSPPPLQPHIGRGDSRTDICLLVGEGGHPQMPH